jgi:hypothetical protein
MCLESKYWVSSGVEVKMKGQLGVLEISVELELLLILWWLTDEEEEERRCDPRKLLNLLHKEGNISPSLLLLLTLDLRSISKDDDAEDVDDDDNAMDTERGEVVARSSVVAGPRDRIVSVERPSPFIFNT